MDVEEHEGSLVDICLRCLTELDQDLDYNVKPSIQALHIDFDFAPHQQHDPVEQSTSGGEQEF